MNARQRVDLVMTPGTVTESIVITDAAQLLETDSSVRGQVVQRDQIVNLPLNGRSYANLALLTPGVRESSQNSTTEAGSEAAFNVNGLRNTVNNFLLDGVDNNAYGTSNQSFSTQVVQVSPDAIQEFKVQTNTYSAEFGRSGGAVINASYRSGTNQFHGQRLGVSSQHGAERGRFLQAGERSQASAHSQPVWRHLRRPDHQGSHLLLS